MPADVTISPADLTRVRRILEAATPDWPKILKRTGVATMGYIDQNFRAQGKLAQPPTGWAPLKPVTVQMRRADWRKAQASFISTGRGMGYRQNVNPSEYKILQDTGELKGSWSYEVNAVSTECRIGSNSIKSGTHQYGRRMFWPLIRRMVTIPARPMIPPERQAIRMFTQIVTWSLQIDLKKAGLKGAPKVSGTLKAGVKA